MGAAAGLIPCPSALVVLLGAVAQGQIAIGMLLIVAFSAGLAVTLTTSARAEQLPAADGPGGIDEVKRWARDRIRNGEQDIARKEPSSHTMIRPEAAQLTQRARP